MAEQLLEDVVSRFKKRSGLSYAQITRKAEIIGGRTTISSWANGYSRHPYEWHDLARFARALELTEDEANQVLVAGGHKPIATLRAETKLADERELLAFWETQSNIIFQVPRVDALEFVGRKDEISDVRQALLVNKKICALVGMGGIGKSTLAQYMAGQLQNHFPDGVLWARVKGEASLMGILHALAATYDYDVGEYSDRDTRSTKVRELLANKKALLILDNIENSVELKMLLPSVGTCAVLVTTRNRQIVRNLSIAPIELTPLAEEDSLKLLSSYLGREKVEAEREGAQALIRFVEGLPLALRVIASTLKEAESLTLHEYAEILADRQERLTYLEDWEDTTKNVRAVFAETYERLNAGFQQLFSKLAVFEGLEFSAAAVAAIAQIPVAHAKLRLGRLTSLSLVSKIAVAEDYSPQWRQEQDVVDRYYCHALLQLFAQEQLGDRLTSVRGRAATYYADFAYQYGSNNRYQWLDLEWPNIAASLSWAHQQTMAETLQRGVAGITHVYLGVVGYLDTRGHWQEAQEILQWAQQTAEKESLLEATTLFKLGAFSFRLAQYEQARSYLSACQSVTEKLPASSEVAWLQAYMSEFMSRLEMEQDSEDALAWVEIGISALQTLDTPEAIHHQGYLNLIKAEVLGRVMRLLQEALTATETGLALLPDEPTPAHITAMANLSAIHGVMGNLAESNQYLNRGIPLAETFGNARQLATMLMNRGINQQKGARLTEATIDLEKAKEVFERIDDVKNETRVWINLGVIYTIWGDYEEAVACLQKAVVLAVKHSILDLEAFAKTTLPRPLLHQGNLAAAVKVVAEALAICRQYRDPLLMTVALLWEGWLQHVQGDTEEGLTLLQQAIALTENSKLDQERGMVRSFQAQMLDAQRAFADAKQAHQQALALLTGQDRYELALAQLALVQHYLYQVSALPEEIADLLATAQASFAELGAERETAVVDSLLAKGCK